MQSNFHIEIPGRDTLTVKGRMDAVKAAKKASTKRAPSVILKREDDRVFMEFRGGRLLTYRTGRPRRR